MPNTKIYKNYVMKDIIPKIYHSDYLNLSREGQIIDTITETEETDTENENIEEDQITEKPFIKEDRYISLKRKKKEVAEKEIATSSVGRGKGKGKGKGRGQV